MKNTLDRIKEYIDFKNISVRAFEISCGFSNGSFSSQLKNRKTIGVDKLENILSIYNDIDGHWLVTGEGEMLRKEDSYYYSRDKERIFNEEISTVKMYLNEIIKSKNEVIEGLKREVKLLNELLRSRREED